MSSYTRFDSFIKTGKFKYQMTKNFTWFVGSMEGPSVTVPTGFVFDLSVPKVLQWLFKPDDIRFLRAAALHDYLLAELHWNRITAAAEFHEALRADEVSKWERICMFVAVVFYKYR